MDEYLIPCLSLLSVSSITGANACRTISFRVRTTAIEFVYLLFDQGISNPLLFIYIIIGLLVIANHFFPVLIGQMQQYYWLALCPTIN